METSEHILRQHTDLSQQQIQLLCEFGMGSVRGNLIANLEIMQNVQKKAIGWLTTFTSETREDLLRTCEKWGKSKNEEWRFLLDFFETWFRDLTWVLHDLPEDQIVNRNGISANTRISELKQCGKYFTLQQIFEIFRNISDSRTAIELNANKSLAIESLCLHIYRSAT
jgi:hypothetical protein